ncbi:MAG: alanine racemase [Pseudomonadota bacterium]
MSRPIRARIDLSALHHNYLLAKSRAPTARAWAVIKGNAYGHGLQRVAQALAEVADGFALLDLNEAVRLRRLGIRQPILLLEGVFAAADFSACVEYALTPVMHCLEQFAMLRTAALVPGCRLPIYLKFNTGMNRLGLSAAELPSVLRELAALRPERVGEITLMTHFADADGVRGIAAQLRHFKDFFLPRLTQSEASLGKQDAPPTQAYPISLANSASILRYPETAYDWIRPGIMLYGGSPFGHSASGEQTASSQNALALGLRPVMTLSSQIISVQQVAAGERIGYGGLFVAPKAMRIGIVACGYADGYPRHAPSGTPVLVDGRRSELLGRVSMDMLACDLTDLPEAGFASPVVLWGEGLAADEVAAAAGTVSYELFCALTERVPIIEQPMTQPDRGIRG